MPVVAHMAVPLFIVARLSGTTQGAGSLTGGKASALSPLTGEVGGGGGCKSRG